MYESPCFCHISGFDDKLNTTVISKLKDVPAEGDIELSFSQTRRHLFNFIRRVWGPRRRSCRTAVPFQTGRLHAVRAADVRHIRVGLRLESVQKVEIFWVNGELMCTWIFHFGWRKKICSVSCGVSCVCFGDMLLSYRKSHWSKGWLLHLWHEQIFLRSRAKYRRLSQVFLISLAIQFLDINVTMWLHPGCSKWWYWPSGLSSTQPCKWGTH